MFILWQNIIIKYIYQMFSYTVCTNFIEKQIYCTLTPLTCVLSFYSQLKRKIIRLKTQQCFVHSDHEFDDLVDLYSVILQDSITWRYNIKCFILIVVNKKIEVILGKLFYVIAEIKSVSDYLHTSSVVHKIDWFLVYQKEKIRKDKKYCFLIFTHFLRLILAWKISTRIGPEIELKHTVPQRQTFE